MPTTRSNLCNCVAKGTNYDNNKKPFIILGSFAKRLFRGGFRSSKFIRNDSEIIYLKGL